MAPAQVITLANGNQDWFGVELRDSKTPAHGAVAVLRSTPADKILTSYVIWLRLGYSVKALKCFPCCQIALAPSLSDWCWNSMCKSIKENSAGRAPTVWPTVVTSLPKFHESDSTSKHKIKRSKQTPADAEAINEVKHKGHRSMERFKFCLGGISTNSTLSKLFSDL